VDVNADGQVSWPTCGGGGACCFRSLLCGCGCETSVHVVAEDDPFSGCFRVGIFPSVRLWPIASRMAGLRWPVLYTLGARVLERGGVVVVVMMMLPSGRIGGPSSGGPSVPVPFFFSCSCFPRRCPGRSGGTWCGNQLGAAVRVFPVGRWLAHAMGCDAMRRI
jgi:hypothetical protein